MNYEKYVKNKFDEYINKSDWRVKENSNSFFSFGALNKHMVGKDSALIWKDYYDGFDKRIIESHNNGDSHIHDLGSVSSYCFGASLKDLLLMGVTGVPNVSVSAPAKRLRTITSQIANIMTIFQNETAGAIAYSSWNSYLAPFLYFDKLERDNLIEKSFGTKIVYSESPYDKKINIDYNELDLADITESVQNMIFALNSNSRAGAEPSFSNLTLDFKIPEPMKNLNVIINGKEVDNFKYKDFQKECDILTSVFSKIMLKGDAHGNAMSYPIPTFNIGKQMDWDNPYYENVWEMSAKYGLPYFGNFVQGNLKEDDVYSMCCFTEDEKVIYKDNYGNIKTDVMKNINEDVKLFNSDGWVNAKKITLPNRKMYKIKTHNGVETIMSDNHINLTYDGDKYTKDLTTNDYLAFNEKSMISYNSDDYMMGKFIGIIAGDGSLSENEIGICLNYDTKDYLVKQIEEFLIKYGLVLSEYVSNSGLKNTSMPVYSVVKNTNDKEASKKRDYLFSKLKSYITFENAHNKVFKDSILNESCDFKQGIIDGYCETDGGNKGRIYSVNDNLIKSFATMLNSMGISYDISVDNRDSTKTLSDNPMYCIRPYGKHHKQYKNFFKRKDDKIFFKITSIEEVDYDKELHSFEMENQNNPYFTLANGLYTHNCRLRLDKRELINKTGGLFGAGEKTGSMGVYTINLPNIAFRSKDKSKSVFFNDLLEQMEIGKKQLIFKKRLIKYLFEKGLYPALKKYLVTLDTLFLTIGIIGANEMCLNYLGEGIETENGRNFTIEVMNFMRDKLADFQEETGELFNLEFSPAEGASYRLAKKSKERYPNIITAGKDEVYFTNSVHLPVGIEWSYKDIYTHQNELLSLATGGSVYHNYLKERLTGEMVKNQIRIIFDNWDIPYLSNSPLYSICEKHGYLQGYNDICPICGASTQNYQRVTGYVRMVSNFNKGKAEEFRQRNQKECDILETK